MKRTAMFLALMLILLSISFTVKAANIQHEVVKGETLSGIAKEYKVKLNILKQNNPHIKSPKFWVYPEQIIIISNQENISDEKNITTQVKIITSRGLKRKTNVPFRWKYAGGNSFKGDTVESLKRQGFSDADIEEFGIKYPMNPDTIVEIENGMCFESMAFGRNKIVYNVIANFQDDKIHLASVYQFSSGRQLFWPHDCGNLSVPVILVIIQQTIISEEQVVYDFPETDSILSEQFDFPDIDILHPKKMGVDWEDGECGAYVGAGNYESVSGNSRGYYMWSNIHCRPLWFNVDKTKVHAGASLNLAKGRGNDEDYHYDWYRWWLGPSFKVYGKHWDFDLDFGYGKLVNNGEIDLYENKQVDDILAFNAHYNNYFRRDDDKKWFPAYEFNLNAIVPISTTQKHSWDGQLLEEDHYNNASIELAGIFSVYDFWLNENARLTPQWNLAFGREFGVESNYFQFGPRFSYSHYSEDILSLSLLNYKKQLGKGTDQIHWFSCVISLGGIVKAWKANRIQYSDEECIDIFNIDIDF